jgi:hypothetical protein
MAKKRVEAAGSKYNARPRAPGGTNDIPALTYPGFLFSFGMLATFAVGEKRSAPSVQSGNTKDDTLAHEDVWRSETSQIANP